MKVATFTRNREWGIGVVDIETQSIHPFKVTAEAAERGVPVLMEMDHLPEQGAAIPLSSVRLQAPVPRPARNIFCVGKNYFEHAHEFSRSGFDSSAAAGNVPKHPIIFSKLPDAVIATNDFIRIDPTVSECIDYEAELAVIIGKGGKKIAAEHAFEHVWGYTIVNDVTARDLQKKYSQWLIGKSQDTFCPMGPWAVTQDEIDISDTIIQCSVNGEPRQEANTNMLIFDIPTLIATLSSGITLQPGDIIATGTPAGVGIGFNPPKYLRDGDVVSIHIQNIGTLENRCIRGAS